MSAHDPKRTCSALVSLPTLRIFQRRAALIIRLFLLSQNSGQALLRSPKIGTGVEPSAEIELWNPEVLSSLSAPSAFKVASSSPATCILCNLRNALAHGGEIRQRLRCRQPLDGQSTCLSEVRAGIRQLALGDERPRDESIWERRDRSASYRSVDF